MVSLRVIFFECSYVAMIFPSEIFPGPCQDNVYFLLGLSSISIALSYTVSTSTPCGTPPGSGAITLNGSGNFSMNATNPINCNSGTAAMTPDFNSCFLCQCSFPLPTPNYEIVTQSNVSLGAWADVRVTNCPPIPPSTNTTTGDFGRPILQVSGNGLTLTFAGPQSAVSMNAPITTLLGTHSLTLIHGDYTYTATITFA